MEKHDNTRKTEPVLPLGTQGLLFPGKISDRFSLRRYFPESALQTFIERYWIVEWKIPEGEEFIQQTIPYPCINMVFERHHSGIFGIETGISQKTLTGSGKAVGIKFKMGGFYPFLKTSVSKITNLQLPVESVFPWFDEKWEEAILTTEEDSRVIAMLEKPMLEKRPRITAAERENIEEFQVLLQKIIEIKTIYSVDELLTYIPWSKRTLQRNFKKYIGVSPKWTIQIFRLQEAAEKLAKKIDIDIGNLAYNLGYFDQAHFSNDFKKATGLSPGKYVFAQ